MSKERIDSVSEIEEPITMVKVKAFDIDVIIKANTEGEYESFKCSKLAIIEGGSKLIVTDADGIHKLYDSDSNKVRLAFAKVEEGFIPMFPDCYFDVSISNFLSEEYKEIELGQFVRRFGSRIESNYRMLFGSIKEVGLDLVYYARGEMKKTNKNKWRIANVK